MWHQLARFEKNQLNNLAVKWLKTTMLIQSKISLYSSDVAKKSKPAIKNQHIVATELKDPIWHSLEWQIGSFSSVATIFIVTVDPY